MESRIDLRWRKSSFSGNGGGNCVEVGQAADGTILVRDTKDRGGAAHRYTPAEWRAFVAGVRNGEFDLDESGSLP
ncbi:MAG TPA: DUF397 domain-containing protein [Streptosporangiaceae bacterium]|nr:DUF397 domain-containing protein [Streptosporangiaceae bacterium]